jgi:hypothetical protein
MGLNEVGPQNEITHDPGIRGRGYVKSRILSQYRGQTVGDRTNAADPLGYFLGIPRVPAHQYLLKSAEHGPGGLGIDDLLFTAHIIDGYGYLEMTFNPGYRVYYFYSRHLAYLLED